jgi:rubrerythrin
MTMPQELKMQEALKQAIKAKKNLMDFYLKAAEINQNPGGKKILERLASEVKENIARFFIYYKGADLGPFENFISTPPHADSAMLVSLQKSLTDNMHERKVREIALKEEEDMERNFTMLAEKMVDPMVRSVFIEVAKETGNHYAIIESEYARTMRMVHETDIDTYVRE